MVTCAPTGVQGTPLSGVSICNWASHALLGAATPLCPLWQFEGCGDRASGPITSHQLCRHGLSLRAGVLQHRAPHLRSPHRQSWCGAEHTLLVTKTSHTRPPPLVSPRLLPSATSYMAASSGRRAWRLSATQTAEQQPVYRKKLAAAASVKRTGPRASAGRREITTNSLDFCLAALRCTHGGWVEVRQLCQSAGTAHAAMVQP